MEERINDTENEKTKEIAEAIGRRFQQEKEYDEWFENSTKSNEI